MKTPPQRLTPGRDGPPRLVGAFNELRDYTIATEPKAGLGVRARETSRGTHLSVERGEPGEGGGAIKQFIFLQMYEDYFTANPYSGTTREAVVIQIAKPWKLRKTPWASGSHTIIIEDGTASPPSVGVTYTYLTNTYRRVSTGTTSEDQVIIPQYRVGDLIYATEPINGTNVNEGDAMLTWQDINADGRAWSKI